jgi:hypothetical protein
MNEKNEIKNEIKKWSYTTQRKLRTELNGIGQSQEKFKCGINRTTPEGSVTQEYAPIGGEADFCRESAKLAFGDNSPVITNGLNVTVQVP